MIRSGVSVLTNLFADANLCLALFISDVKGYLTTMFNLDKQGV